MEKFDYLIVGSGITGSVFAYEASLRGKRCLVLEKRKHIGGNIYDKNEDGILVHQYGAHIFHTSKKDIWNYIQKFSRFNHYINSPIANFKGEIYNLPFNMNTFSRLWNISTPEEAFEKIESEKVKLDFPPENLEEQALSLVGKTIYEKLIRGYTEKQWGRKCCDLPTSILSRIPLRFTYDNNYFSDPYQGIPVDGYTSIINKMLSKCDVLVNTDYFANREHFNSLAKKIFYTGMIDAYFNFKLGKLEYRSLKFEEEHLDISNFQGVAVVNYTDKKTPFTRIIEHKHFQFGTQPFTIITKEYPSSFSFEKEPYYPINDSENMALYEKYKALSCNEKNVIFCGRLAEYQYYNMDQAISAALSAAKSELVGKI